MIILENHPVQAFDGGIPIVFDKKEKQYKWLICYSGHECHTFWVLLVFYIYTVYGIKLMWNDYYSLMAEIRNIRMRKFKHQILDQSS